ncbi:MAG: MlaD family protein [Rhodocyclaceae bacterium]|nr:MlaD family protein [Rhodocyclaceae bacterium]
MTDLPDIPEARVKTRGRFRFDLIWLVPLIAALIGGWLGVRAILERGPTVTITFQTAEGLEAGKTYISYKDVKVGLVKKVSLSEDRSRVEVTAEFTREAAPMLVEDSRFWVVRPRFSGGQFSGLNTLLAGEHIELDVGKSATPSRQFTGLEVAPIVTSSLPGRAFMLRAPDLGSLDVGSPIFYRRLKVGQVDSFELEKDGSGVSLKIFVQAPYDRYVTPGSRFWNASGVDLTMDSSGLRVQTQSLMSVMVGGVAFETPPGAYGAGADDSTPAKANATFLLHGDRAAAMKAPDGEMQVYLLNFKESLRGLSRGAPLDFRGIVVGEVLATGVEYEPGREWFNFPVYVALYPERIRVVRQGGKASRKSGAGLSDAQLVKRGLVTAMIERGFRAQLRTGSLVTGQLYVALDFFKDAKPVAIDTKQTPPELPTVRGDLEDLQQSLKSIAKSLSGVKFDEIGAGVQQTLASVNQILQHFDKELAPELKASLHDLQRTLKAAERTLATDSPVMSEVLNAAHEVSRAAQSLRSLADLLDRQPEALIKGKQP